MVHPENFIQVYGKQVERNEWVAILYPLCPNTEYTVRVAGATDAGIGVFSVPITFKTFEGILKH